MENIERKKVAKKGQKHLTENQVDVHPIYLKYKLLFKHFGNLIGKTLGKGAVAEPG